jgi:hypothetical protein
MTDLDHAEADPQSAPRPKVFTVIGIWQSGLPIVVGVVAGARQVHGGDWRQFEQGLWATSVTADGVEQAEALAKADMLRNNS